MANTVTDSLDLIKEEVGKGFLRMLPRKIGVVDGYCLVIFRKNDYLGLLSSDDIIAESDLKRYSDRIGVRENDSIMRVNTGPRTLYVKESLSTRDGYQLSYELMLEVHVSDPRKFAQKYRQQSDPVNLAKIAIEGYIQRYIIRTTYDDVTYDMIGDLAKQALEQETNKQFGLQVTNVLKTELLADPRRAKEIELEQTKRLRVREIETDSEIKRLSISEQAEVDRIAKLFELEQQREQSRFAREEDREQREHTISLESFETRERAKLQADMDIKSTENQFLIEQAKNRFTREEERKALQFKNEIRQDTRVYEIEEQNHTFLLDSAKHEHDILLGSQQLAYERREALLKIVGDKAVQALSERISLEIEDGSPLIEVFNDYPELKDIFLIPGQTGGNRSTKGQAQINAGETNKQSITGTFSEAEVSTTKTSGNTGAMAALFQQPNNTWHIPLGLDLIEVTLSDEQKDTASVSTDTFFMICRLGSDARATRPPLKVGDILIEMDGHVLQSGDELSAQFKNYMPGTTADLCILRGDELQKITVS